MYRPYSSSLPDSRPFLDVESVLRGFTQDFVTSFNTGNYDQVAALFAPDGVFMAPHRDPACGPKAVERLLREFGEAGYEGLRVASTHRRRGIARAAALARRGIAAVCRQRVLETDVRIVDRRLLIFE